MERPLKDKGMFGSLYAAQLGSRDATTECLVTCADVWAWPAWCKKRPSARLCRYGEIERFPVAKLACYKRCMWRGCARQKSHQLSAGPDNHIVFVCSLFGLTQVTKRRDLACVRPGRREPGSLLRAWLRWAVNQTRP